MFYNHKEIENKWQKFWQENQTYKTSNDQKKPKYYVLDMFPYPSGAGLHVGHPLGYIASDIYARYKRHQGFNVLHPIGYDSFGLPAEQYAIQTGQHPAITTEENISRYETQLQKIGFSFDWDKELRTSDSSYYKWTQWIFIQLFHSWYNNTTDKAEPIITLEKHLETFGTKNLNAAQNEPLSFSDEDWKNYSTEKKQEILLNYRLAFRAETMVNWCPALGTVLANDEVINGKSERGGYPVYQKKMTQWSMRITAYSERLLQGLDNLDWSDAVKDSQRNWIGKSTGASIIFPLQEENKIGIEVFTTRPDTIFGVSFLTLAPEHELVKKITTLEQEEAVEAYIEATSKRSERERMSDVKTISGVFTGAYAQHPITKQPIPIWIGDYVLAGYGTGAVMAVPSGDERDYDFANYFNLPIINIFDKDISEKAYSERGGFKLQNSDFLNGLDYQEATEKIIAELEKLGIGKAKINYRQRDAIFSRQRYWGEPVPIYYKDNLPYTLPISALPLELPKVETYLPTEDGEPPLGNAKKYAWDTDKQMIVNCDLIDNKSIFPLELSTMPGWAGSSWYFLRYMNNHNNEAFCDKAISDYWGQVDLYIGGSEHATGHLLYSRFWNMFLKDRGYISHDEPFKKMINQGMILGMSAFVFRLFPDYPSDIKAYLNENGKEIKIPENLYVSKKYALSSISYKQKVGDLAVKDDFKEGGLDFYYNKVEIPNELKELGRIYYEKLKELNPNNPVIPDLEKVLFLGDCQTIYTDVSLLKGTSDEMDLDKFKAWRPEFKDAEFILENGKYIVEREVEKMSKSKYNVVNPDDICEEYGADCLRLYEMFLGPLEQSKPWNTQGLSGVYGFLKKFYNLYFDGDNINISEEEPSKEEYKILHTLIKKVVYDIEHFSFNTSVSSFMIAINDLQKLKCNKRAILEPLAIIISPYAPHICEELWQILGHSSSIEHVKFPELNEKYLIEDEIEYPVSFNGKMRFKISLPSNLTAPQIEEIIMRDERTLKQLEGKSVKKSIIIPKKIINIVF